MNQRNTKKLVLGIGSFALFVFLIILLVNCRKHKCMNLPIISYEQLSRYEETTSLDISKITFEGERVAVDYSDNRIYISQLGENLKHYYTLQGKFVPMLEEYSLFILKTPELYDIPKSVSQGNPLQLIILNGENFQKVNLIISTLPILNLKFECETKDEDGRQLNQGKFTLWNNSPETSAYETVNSFAEWRIRGNSTRSYAKQSWKLNLREMNGENKNLNLLGLGADDDWILNPMSMDDTKVKEKLSQEIWEDLVSYTDYNHKMSSGEYIEVVINGAYQGLYLLQRRVDGKYLGLNPDKDILLKGKNLWEAETVQDAYEVIRSPLNDRDTYEKLEFVLQNNHYINLKNFVDLSLFLQFLSANDNYGYKNMFYILQKRGKDYELSWVPWDTDLSFGVTWGYSYEESIHAIIERQELCIIRNYEKNVDKLLAQRWKELRKTVYSEENILIIFNRIMDGLSASGGIQRDSQCWGILHSGQDNYENLKKFINERLEFLDNYYAQ